MSHDEQERERKKRLEIERKRRGREKDGENIEETVAGTKGFLWRAGINYKRKKIINNNRKRKHETLIIKSENTKAFSKETKSFLK